MTVAMLETAEERIPKKGSCYNRLFWDKELGDQRKRMDVHREMLGKIGEWKATKEKLK